jgi:hypothetical protein
LTCGGERSSLPMQPDAPNRHAAANGHRSPIQPAAPCVCIACLSRPQPAPPLHGELLRVSVRLHGLPVVWAREPRPAPLTGGLACPGPWPRRAPSARRTRALGRACLTGLALRDMFDKSPSAANPVTVPLATKGRGAAAPARRRNGLALAHALQTFTAALWGRPWFPSVTDRRYQSAAPAPVAVCVSTALAHGPTVD